MPQRQLPDGRIIDVPEGTTPAQIQAWMEAHPAPKTEPEPEAAPEQQQSMVQSLSRYLPTVGGAIGGLIGGSKASPVGAALAAVGGAAGEGYKQLVNHASELPGAIADVARNTIEQPAATLRGLGQGLAEGGIDAAKAGGEQGLLEGTGRAATAIVRPGAKIVYGLAMRPSRAIARDVGGGSVLKGLSRLTGQGIDDAILPTSRGVDRAGRLMGESRDAATAMAAQSPDKVVTRQVLHRAEADQAAQMGEAMKLGQRPNTRALVDQIKTAERVNPPEMDMGQLLEMRRAADKSARAAFDAEKMGGAAVTPGTSGSVQRSMSGAAKDILDKNLGEAFQNANATSQVRHGLQQVAAEAAARPNALVNFATGGGAVMSMGSPDILAKLALARLLASPTAQAGAAIGMARAPYAQLFRAGNAIFNPDDEQ